MTEEAKETAGLVVVDKPAGWTSHDVVARCRRIFGQKRVGHAGTLDPDATGVLLVGLGRATRLIRYLGELPKTYTGEVVLGTATSTLDSSGEVVGTWDMTSVTIDAVRAAAATLVGDILQVPPMVSAVQIGGQRLHELARQGIEVERAPRPVTVHRFDVGPAVGPGVFPVEVECSSGTYIRTLAADVGTALGGGAHLRNLRRTAIGSFGDDVAVALEQVGADHVLTPAEMLRDRPAFTVNAEAVAAISHGKALPRPEAAEGTGPWRVLDGDGRLLAVYEARADGDQAVLRPSVVLAAG